MSRSPLRGRIAGRRWRTLMTGVALVATLGLAGGALAACSTSSTPSASGGKDSLRVALAGGGPGTVLDAHVLTDPFATWFAWSFYETIGNFDENGTYYDVLAESFTPNADATQWTLVLKDGITFHSGKALTADDIIFTFDRILDPATGATGAGTAAVISSMTKIDDKTVVFNLSAPRGTFPETLSDGSTMGIVPTGYDVNSPDSTGPWVFQSYNPGVDVSLTRYDGYHGTPAKVASLSYVALPDNDARTNALVSGQVDVDAQMAASSLPRIQSDPNLTLQDVESGGFQVISMRVDQGPTADPRVREALRLAVDREQIRTVVDGGRSRIGNDLYGIDDPDYRSDLVRPHDVEKAKQLIAEAGATGAKLTLVTISTLEPVTQIVAQNARDIGLDVTVDVRDPAVFYSDGYTEYDFATDIWPSTSILNVASLTDGPNAVLNYTHFSDPEFDALYNEAASTMDPAVRTQALSQMQQILFDRGGFIIATFPSLLHVVPTATTGWATTDPKGGINWTKSIPNVSWTS